MAPSWAAPRVGVLSRSYRAAIGRDAALGGMGLHLVARLSCAYGWAVDGDRKVVWALIAYRLPAPRPSPQRIRAATARARDLVACLAVTEARITATLHRLAADAAVEGRSQRAPAYRAVAQRAQEDAEQARWTSHAVPPVPEPSREAADPTGPTAL